MNVDAILATMSGAWAKIADRYVLEAKLGQGAHGEVWRSRDQATGDPVAVKLLHPRWSLERSRVRREVAALRLLRIPGVVRLLDEGLHDGVLFLAMEIIDGHPFPGAIAPLPWDQLASTALALLETLDRVHEAGVLHCDLKPSNVLVRRNGTVVLLDFGIADIPRNGWDNLVPEGSWLGTLSYLAPEVLLGDSPNRGTDLYAAGLMIVEAATGLRPFRAMHPGLAIQERLQPDASSIRRQLGVVPGPIAELLAALLTGPAEERGPVAAELASGLQNSSTEVEPWLRHLPETEPISAEMLRELFVGADRVLHLREDAAKILHARTGGCVSAVTREIGAWVRAGVAKWDGSGIRVTRQSVEVLSHDNDASPQIAALRGLAASWTNPHLPVEDITRQSISHVRELIQGGQNVGATGIALETARLARLTGGGDPAQIAELFSLWIEIAAQELRPHGLDVFLYEIGKAPPSANLACIAELAQAALDIGQDPVRAGRRLDQLGPLRDPALERVRAGLRMVAARSEPLETEREVLHRISDNETTISDVTTAARLLGWRGRLEYRLNNFEEAARLHAQSADKLERPIERAAALLNAASANVEACNFEAALTNSMTARTILGSRRNALIELRCEWIDRLAQYRLGSSLAADDELIEIADAVTLPGFVAPLLLLEASVCLRNGLNSGATQHARRASAIWRSLQALPDLVLLCDCLVYACDPAGRDDSLTLVSRAHSATTFGIEIQALGLLRMSGVAAADEFLATAWEAIPAKLRSTRLDVLSPLEALGAASLSHIQSDCSNIASSNAPCP